MRRSSHTTRHDKCGGASADAGRPTDKWGMWIAGGADFGRRDAADDRSGLRFRHRRSHCRRGLSRERAARVRGRRWLRARFDAHRRRWHEECGRRLQRRRIRRAQAVAGDVHRCRDRLWRAELRFSPPHHGDERICRGQSRRRSALRFDHWWTSSTASVVWISRRTHVSI